MSVEDNELQFHVYMFNVEAGMEINYTDGTSKVEGRVPAKYERKVERNVLPT
ncbi:hypothetical protein ONC83_003043 [Listeria monocytogenes]|nr:hypothetical protein [Listeria monocytogenes]